MSKINLPNITPIRVSQDKELSRLTEQIIYALKKIESELQRLEDNKQDI